MRIDVYHHFGDLGDALVLLRCIVKNQETIMATFQELSDELDAIKTAVEGSRAETAALKAEVQALKDQIAAGTPVTQEQLDALDAKADSILETLSQP